MPLPRPRKTHALQDLKDHGTRLTLRDYRNKKTYVSPSDNIMSPCTAKLNALRNKQVGK